MRKICIIDSYSHKNFHEMGNACLLAECLSITHEVLYFSGASALKSLNQIMSGKDLKGVVFKAIPVVEGNSKVHTLLRFFLSAIVNCSLLLKSEKNTIVFYNYNNVFSLLLINFLNKFLKRKTAILCHGEFEIIFNKDVNRKQNLFWKIYFYILMNFFTKEKNRIAEEIIFLFLGDNIKTNLKTYVPDNIYKKIYAIDQSYIDKHFDVLKRNREVMIKIGMIGQIRKGKNISDVILLTKKLLSEISSGKLGFLIVGTAVINTGELKSAGIIIPEGKNLLSREEYDNKIAKLDYVLFFYNKDMYKFTASGPLMDAIFLEKPIIALKNNYFEYMFKKYGDFGILVDSIDEMAELIKELATGKKLPPFDFKNIKDKLHPEKIALQLKTAFEEAGFYK